MDDVAGNAVAMAGETPGSAGAAGAAPVHELVARAALAAPGATALVQGARRLTYRTLLRRAADLAARLQAAGVVRGDRVVLAAHRSPELVIGMLAVLQAGAAYIPVDPGYPAKRLEYLIGDADARLVLTEPAVRAALPGLTGPWLDLPDPIGADGALDDDADGGTDDDTDDNPAQHVPQPVPVGPDDIAYCIYTSGSTGLPKGVQIPHAGLSNLVAWHCETYALTARDRTTQIAGTAFDASVWEIWPTLAVGGELHLATDRHATAPELVGWLADQGVTVSFLPTPLAELVLAEPWPARTRLRYLLTGGDRLHRRPPHGLPFTLVNHYGPTECSVVATAGEVPPGGPAGGGGGNAGGAGGGAGGDGDDAAAEPSIGRPIRGIRAVLLDDRLCPVPDGERGELYLSGVGLARGYLNRPDLTAERFVLLEPGGERHYRTGDLAVRRPDGSLGFIGREDGQVKLRGFRIELGEIESVLCGHPDVAAAAVALREDLPGEPRLVAYPVLRSGAVVNSATASASVADDEVAHSAVADSAALRAWLAERLPGHQVPSLVVPLAELPLTRNGKVDRAALPVPQGDQAAPAGEYVAPRPGAEAEVAELWGQVLGVERVGALDDFFLLGGSSLSAARVVGALRERHRVDLATTAVFTAPTVRRLTAALAAAPPAAETGGGEAGLPALDRTRPLPLSPSQRRAWLMSGLDDTGAAYNVPLAVELRGPLDPDALHRALREVVARHESLRSRYVAQAGTPVQLAPPALAPDELPPLDLLLHEPGSDAEQEELTARLAAHRFDLAAGPVLRCALLRRAADHHVLVVVVHHVAFDGWSLGVFARDLADCYRAATAGVPAPARPQLQPADVARRLQHDADRAMNGPHADYWEQALKGAPQDLGLPTDHPRPHRITGRGARQTAVIGAATVERLHALCRAEGVTLFTALVALCQAYLARVTGAQDVVIGSPVAGRTEPDTHAMVGCFINTLPLRTDLSGAPGFRELLHRVRGVVLGAFEHQDTPFERIVELSGAGRTAGQNPVYQIVFALEDAHRAELEFAGLSAAVTELDAGTSARTSASRPHPAATGCG